MKRIFIIVFLLFLFSSFSYAKKMKYSKRYLYKKYYSKYTHTRYKWAIGPYITIVPGIAIGGTFKYNLQTPLSIITNFSLSGSGSLGAYVDTNLVYNFYIYDLKEFVPYAGGGTGIYIGNNVVVFGFQINGGGEFFIQKNISIYLELGIAIGLASNFNIGARWYF